MEKIKRSVFQEGMPIAFFNGGILMDITNYSEEKIVERENALHAWFTKGCDPMLSQIDGLDIGWGGVQRWATFVIPPTDGVHLDIACGYATFLAQLGWRFPRARLVGLNIDFMALMRESATPFFPRRAWGHHSWLQTPRRMPFMNNIFRSASCFLGLQDIEMWRWRR